MKIQKLIRFYSLFVFIFMSFRLPAAQNNLINQADSLFEQKQFTESFELYHQIYHEQQMASPQMLLKMAFIKEGLNDHMLALYYLIKYYQLTYDEDVLQKIASLAEENELYGYEYDDFTFFMNFYQKYRSIIIYLFLFLSLVFLIITLLVKVYRKRLSINLLILCMVMLVGYAITLNVDPQGNYLIVEKRNSPLMSGPSSASNVYSFLEKGHRLEISGQKDNWFKVHWNNRDLFIKKENVIRL